MVDATSATPAIHASLPKGHASPDYAETERLKTELAKARQTRRPFYLTVDEFEEVLRWKLRQQIGRQRDLRAANTEELIRAVTGLALTITHSDSEYELELRVGILRSLRGVAVPVASAVLALAFPEKYAVIDFRGWRQIFDEKRTTFTIPDYKRYLAAIQRLANELSWPPQEVDLAIWEYDRKGG
jgi:hypothetical protein